MRVLLTGAGGFVGRAVAAALARDPRFSQVRLVDRAPMDWHANGRLEPLVLDLAHQDALATALDGMDGVIHLASIPGGTAEADPPLSRAVNLDATLAMLEHLDARGQSTRFVYASSIAVLGHCTAPVDDATVPAPGMVYGAHKRMVELAVADFHRRGCLDGLSLRLPGIVARPHGAGGLKSSFMSDIFHAAARAERFTLPVSAAATMWLMSARTVADNLIHALMLPTVDGSAITLPALRVGAGELARALYADAALVTYHPDLDLERGFGAYPPLTTAIADGLGFRHEGTLEALVGVVREQIMEGCMP